MKTGRPERSGGLVALLCFLLSLGVLLGTASILQAQERTGSITGELKDASGGVLPGASVILTNKATGRASTAVTDGGGMYRVDLDPGIYTVRFEMSGFARQEQPDVEVLLGRTFTINATMKVGNMSEAVQVTAESAPQLDTRSTVIAHNVTAEQFDRLPKTRSFQSIALTAPSVNSGDIEGGFQVNGASGAENSFTVDGVVTNSLIYGSSRQNTAFDYLQEVQVKTTGISAEYGGALGGVISAVTKSGGNTLHGEGHYYFEGSAISAAPVKRLVLNPFDDTTVGYTQDKKSPARQNEFGGSVGGPIVRDRLFFYGSYSPRNEVKTNTYNATDGVLDIKRDIWRQQAFGKLGYASKRVNANWSTLWTPTKATGTHSSYNGPLPNQVAGTVASLKPQLVRGYETNQVNTSGTVDITLGKAAFLEVRGGFFHDRYSDTGISQTTSYAYQTPTTTLNSIIPAALQGGTNVSGVNTPRAQITSFDTTRRETFDLDYNHSLNFGGFHTFKAGYGFQHVLNDIDSYYPGGYVNIFWDRAFSFGGTTIGTGRGTYGYYEVNDRRISNQAGSDIHSIFAQDQWQVNARLTLNLGLRTEHEIVPTFRPDILKDAYDFGFGDKLAPRLGAAYDVSGDGRTKVFGSWGRYYDWTKYELVRGSFGAETWCIYYRALDTLDLASLNLTNKPGTDVWTTPGTCRDRRIPSFQSAIDPNTKPMSQDSVSTGIDHQLNSTSMLTVHYVHNNLRDTIEDIGYLTPQNNEGYAIGNPGKGVATLQFHNNATPPGQAMPLAIRKYDALEIGFDRRFSNNWFFNANYTLSRLWGNYPGLGSSDEITLPTTGSSAATAQQSGGSVARPGSNASRAWDLDELLWDSHGNLVTGRLATDRPHVVKLYGAYRTPFGTQIGAFFYGGSGTPMTTYVMSSNTTGGIGSMVEGRGDMGRTPVLTRTDMLVSHSVPLPGNKHLKVELNVLNLFNQKTSRYIFNGLNRGSGAGGARPSAAIDLSKTDLTKGYDYNALILASSEGAAAYDPRYGKDALFQDGLTSYFTFKYEF
jgi:Carboxypeptidase regulatory-like domain/TonB dependent receptor/TonB-dependent Receptor Plug Domain